MKEQKGQGLIEMIVSFAVITIGLMGAFGLVLTSLSLSNEVESRITASQLAWEGVEVARNIRDSNWLEGTVSWADGLGGGVSTETAIAVFDPSTAQWVLDFNPTDFTDEDTILYRQAGVYAQDVVSPGGTATKYRRLITIDPLGPSRLRVTSEVRWTEKGRDFSSLAQGELYEWR